MVRGWRLETVHAVHLRPGCFSGHVSHKTSQVTYVTMVPRVGNETLRPLGATMGNASSVTRA